MSLDKSIDLLEEQASRSHDLEAIHRKAGVIAEADLAKEIFESCLEAIEHLKGARRVAKGIALQRNLVSAQLCGLHISFTEEFQSP